MVGTSSVGVATDGVGVELAAGVATDGVGIELAAGVATGEIGTKLAAGETEVEPTDSTTIGTGAAGVATDGVEMVGPATSVQGTIV